MGDCPPIAIVSLACRYPEAATPRQLWENVLAGRRSFRALPAARLAIGDYAPGLAPDSETISPIIAGLISDWSFDRSAFRVPKSAFDQADLTHWLALEVASEAIREAGGLASIGAERTAVIVGNTLTGEFSRSAALRLRLPFLRRLLAQAAEQAGLSELDRREVLAQFSRNLRDRLPAPDEESLAGGLANTIAGRIANHHDLHGGAWTVDGACASSLLAVADACERLASGSVDAAVVGAVDLSLDPFELVGFSRNGALAEDDMRVFDRRAEGFWPGEGCGFAVLMRSADAHAAEHDISAELIGWGLSADGRGGITRPSEAGQLRALQFAYRRAAVDPSVLGYLEAHGTGTQIGDPTEVRAIAGLLGPNGAALPIGSIKANIGHTKAAAGFAGLIKTIFALKEGVVPPHVGCYEPHPVFAETAGRVTPAGEGQDWPTNGARLAGVSAFGFGGINSHVVLRRSTSPARKPVVAPNPLPQDCELIPAAAENRGALAAVLRELADKAQSLTVSQLSDLGFAQVRSLPDPAEVRAAVLAHRPDQLATRLQDLADLAERGETRLTPGDVIFLANATAAPPRIGFLFPGQAAPVRTDGGLWTRRFPEMQAFLSNWSGSEAGGSVATELAQPVIVGASLAGLQVLRACGLEARAALGHSLGELTALAWSGALSADELLSLVQLRGRLMAAHARPGGRMLQVAATADRVRRSLGRLPLSVACLNAQADVVVSGPAEAVDAFAAQLRARGIACQVLPVSHAFHSADMVPVVEPYAAVLAGVDFAPVRERVFSTISGGPLGADAELPELLRAQLIAPVRFAEALAGLAAETDLLIEVGPGSGLSRLAGTAGHPAASLDAFEGSLQGLLATLALAWVRGAPVDLAPLWAGRPLRELPSGPPRLLSNPCGSPESAAEPGILSSVTVEEMERRAPTTTIARPTGANGSVLEHLRTLVADDCGLPLEAVAPEARLLGDLHMNSLRVSRLVATLVQDMGVPVALAPSEFANASLVELADAVEETARLSGGTANKARRIEGVEPWIGCYAMEWRPAAAPRRGPAVAWCGASCPLAVDDDIAAKAFGRTGESGLLLSLPAGAGEAEILALWRACQAAVVADATPALAILHRDAPIAAFARSLKQEGCFRRVLLLDLAEGAPREPVGEILAHPPGGFAELRVAADGSLLRPVFRPQLHAVETSPARLGPDDVILCTGGARGIGAECALRVAHKTGARLLLLGRSAPENQEVAATLERAKAEGITAHYRSADVTDLDQLGSAVRDTEAGLGPVTALLYAAGENRPDRFADLGEAALHRTLAPKLAGLRHCLAATDPSRLRLVVTFGSIIGRLGLPGETHYALANALQTRLMERLGADLPQVRTLALEWSVWAGCGMGERLGTLERLAAQGVDALPLDRALDAFERLVVTGQGPLGVATVVTSRFGPPPDVDLGAEVLPLLRFLDVPRIHFPGVELIVETEVAPATDPYLEDHRLDGMAVMPGVMLLEAMAQAAAALAEADTGPTDITDVQFVSAILVNPERPARLRIAAQRSADGAIRCIVRSGQDDFAATRCAATFRWDTDDPEDAVVPAPAVAAGAEVAAAADWYGPLFFHGPRFQRVARYPHLAARGLTFELTDATDTPWFGQYLPQTLLLRDPSMRDALLHGLQAAVPHKRVLPESVARIRRVRPDGVVTRVTARETAASGERFVFDIAGSDGHGRVVEVWEGVAFRAIDRIDLRRRLPELTSCWLERRLGEVLDRRDLRVALVAQPGGRHEVRRQACRHLGIDPPLSRGDGAPISRHGAQHVSLAYAGDACLAAAGPDPLGCDLEHMEITGEAVPLDGRDTGLVPELVAQGDSERLAELRLWGARECLRKLGIHDGESLALARAEDDHVLLAAGSKRIVSLLLPRDLVASFCCPERASRLASGMIGFPATAMDSAAAAQAGAAE